MRQEYYLKKLVLIKRVFQYNNSAFGSGRSDTMEFANVAGGNINFS